MQGYAGDREFLFRHSGNALNLNNRVAHAASIVGHGDITFAHASLTIIDTTFVQSIYFKDPDGILLEFAGWTRELNEHDIDSAILQS
jgi:hypothetical protein